MKPKEEKKLTLGKETIQDLDTVLDRDDQKRVKGGSKIEGLGTTEVPIFC
ncbi:MAG: hypothetical protein GTO45_06680 [Candidatus Aminicenantes bacterium]|nr:hypothetical protein [Candidatus Aminicenantes bacterium]NIM78527.1 hypothetical protein [Candidatus Aminicenantes bacterium]NIN17772.1 hypothetical protein [Candidatus Aminicenantes bacterium]NIN41674.1 hypothetical protein [Candidatus Aminicenantes bacterium]NIN84423.1 hypothetical protein [Candidatus Aminicenantes bacterium]